MWRLLFGCVCMSVGLVTTVYVVHVLFGCVCMMVLSLQCTWYMCCLVVCV